MVGYSYWRWHLFWRTCDFAIVDASWNCPLLRFLWCQPKLAVRGIWFRGENTGLESENLAQSFFTWIILIKTLIPFFFPAFGQFSFLFSSSFVSIALCIGSACVLTKSSREILFYKNRSKSHKMFLRGIPALCTFVHPLSARRKRLISHVVRLHSIPSTQVKGLTLSEGDKELCPLVDWADLICLSKVFKLIKNNI